MADPGFPAGGGLDLVGGGVDSRGGYILKIRKTKELGPLGGARAGHAPLDPPMHLTVQFRYGENWLSERLNHYFAFWRNLQSETYGGDNLPANIPAVTRLFSIFLHIFPILRDSRHFMNSSHNRPLHL